MGPKRRSRHSFTFPIAWKFFLLLGVIVPSLLAVSWVGERGMVSMKSRLDSVYNDNVTSTEVVGTLSSSLHEAEAGTLRLVAEVDPDAIVRVRTDLRERVFPAVEQDLSDFRSASVGEAGQVDPHLVHELQSAWDAFLAYTNTPDFEGAAAGPFRTDQDVSAVLESLSGSMNSFLREVQAKTLAGAQEARQAATRTYSHSLALLRVIVGLGLCVGIGATLWLIRAVVVRIREYSGFAAEVAAGELHSRIRPRGHDELTDLGWALNRMVEQGEAQRRYELSQEEFVEAMQVTENEAEAHGLLQRHLERSIPEGSVVVLNRNNSDDRLEASTELPIDSPFEPRLAEAAPRDCFAIRRARSHEEGAGVDPLITCTLCGPIEGLKTCRPLVVGGEVIGSVLLQHGSGLSAEHRIRLRDSVGQAAPVLANLRNLAIAELRAATDALSGLPNARAVQDTLKRLVAQAGRVMWPLSAVLLDLDHFKMVNDTQGHARGDEVLAAVGVALQSAVRGSDFVGRYGGEEFIMLLPDTARDQAVLVAERVRVAISEIGVLDGDRRVTASFGVASYPDDAPDATRLLRNADRALYQAKANGRNRVELFAAEAAPDDVMSPTTGG